MLNWLQLQPREAWTLVGHGECALKTARREERQPPSFAEVEAAFIALGRALTADLWVVRLEATRAEVLDLMEADKALLVSLHGRT